MEARKFIITHQPGGYGMFYVDGRKIDGDKNTVAYFIRQMCGLPHVKRPSFFRVAQVCAQAKETGKPATLIVE